MDSIPVLSLTAYAPAVGALLIFLVPGFQKEKARLIALIASLVSFVLSIGMAIDFDKNDKFQYEEHASWLSGVGASYHLGIDGIALLLIVLTTLIMVISVIWSWRSSSTRPAWASPVARC